MNRRFITGVWLGLLLVSCAAPTAPTQPPPSPVPAAIGFGPAPAIPSVPHASLLRFALVGQPQDVNVWALFDKQGAHYANYALMSGYWPRLYTLAPPNLIFTPYAATGLPTPFIQLGNLYTSIVSLRPDLKWTDGSPFTADDVAFTVNTAVTFELGFDWKAYYSPEYIDHAEVFDSATVLFYFKRKPNIATWQYGALQGPILQKAFWEPRIAGAFALLPDMTLAQDIAQIRAYVAELERDVNDLNHQIITLRWKGMDDYEASKKLRDVQQELESNRNALAMDVQKYTSMMESARGALYALDDINEPTLGPWMPAGPGQGNQVRLANPNLPFERPNFDQIFYFSFSSPEEAMQALREGQVDAVLSQDGAMLSGQTSPEWPVSLNGSARFLVFNLANPVLADTALRQALACMIWSPVMDQAAPLAGFILPGNEGWRNPQAVSPCADLSSENLNLRLERAVQILKSAGYSWTVEPTNDVWASGLVMPNGEAFPPLVLIGPSKDHDPLQAGIAALISTQATHLGLPITVEYMTPQDIRYQVLSAKKYDMAIFGWRLGLYPGYLCDWFGEAGQFDYGESSLKSECEALEVETDMPVARDRVYAIQSILVRDLPFIPLYAGLTPDLYAGISYPFGSVLGGLSSLYGAPSLAIPSP